MEQQSLLPGSPLTLGVDDRLEGERQRPLLQTLQAAVGSAVSAIRSRVLGKRQTAFEMVPGVPGGRAGGNDETSFWKLLLATLLVVFIFRRLGAPIDLRGITDRARPPLIECSPARVEAGAEVRCAVTRASDNLVWEKVGDVRELKVERAAGGAPGAFVGTFRTAGAGVAGLSVTKFVFKRTATVKVVAGAVAAGASALQCAPKSVVAGGMVRCAVVAKVAPPPPAQLPAPLALPPSSFSLAAPTPTSPARPGPAGQRAHRARVRAARDPRGRGRRQEGSAALQPELPQRLIPRDRRGRRQRHCRAARQRRRRGGVAERHVRRRGGEA